ncbi:MAG: site-2 protease family protein [Candidatus Tantalella remota]|nr:site-2 protease family protein [Candidatus Tantalella remota]
MRGTFRLARVLGIDIDIHVTFFLLLGFFFLMLGFKGLVLILGVFLFVTIHELCHSIAAAHFGIKVKRITLLPIGGVALLPETPAKAHQELIISIAGPLSNLAIVVIFYYPLYLLLGREALLYPLQVITGQAKYTGSFNVIAHIYWINLVLAVFNMLPAFPMDGGRALRALLSYKMGFKKATQVAVRLGHIFALVFAYLGIVNGNIILLVVAVFIYMAASSEGTHVVVTETIKNYSVKNILAEKFETVSPSTPLSAVLERTFHTHQEDYPVMDDDRMEGFITRREVINGMHQLGRDAMVGEVMRRDIPPVGVDATLDKVQKLMLKYVTKAMPVEKNGSIKGVVTSDDINRVYVMMQEN